MEIVSGLLSGLSLTVIVVVSVVLFINADKLKKDTETTMKDVVDQINDSQYYAYKFDKKQEQNIMNLDSNIQNVDKKTDNVNAMLLAKEQALKNDIGTLQRDAVKQNQIVDGVPYIKTGKIQLGDQHLLSGVGDVHSGGKPDGWLRVFDKDGKGYNGGVAMKNLWTGENAWMNGNVNLNGATHSHGNLNIRGGTSEHNPNGWWTHFPWSGDNKNYIRGDTEIRGNTNNIGDLNVGRHLNVQGRMHFKDPAFDTNANWNNNSSDSYYLEKKVESNNVSSLRLTLNDDNDESMQIWGGSCAAGNCNGQGTMKHKLGADGNSWHSEWLDARNVTGREHVRAGNWGAWMRHNGDMSANNKLGVGIHPDNQGNFKFFVDGNINGEWSSLVRNGPTHVYMGHKDGYGMHINTQRAGGEYALQIYSANGELMKVQNDGKVMLGRTDGNGEVQLRSKNVYMGGNYDGDVGATLYMGGTQGDNAFDHTVIESRNYGGVDKSELLLFKGNDPIGGCGGSCGPDRIRLRAAEIDFDVYNNYTTDRNAENIVAKVTQDRLVTPRLQLGEKFLLSGVGDTYGNDGWMRILDKNGSGYYGGLAAASLWTQNFVNASDANLKKDVENVSKEDLDKLSKLEPKKYNWKDTNKPDYGFIAQDVEKVYPDLVKDGPNNVKSLNYQGILPMVVGNIKEMKKTIPDDKKVCIGDTCVNEEELKKIKQAISNSK